MTRKPKTEFATWAASYQGMDGGNPKSDLWFCGIEFGGTDDPSKIKFLEDVEDDWIEWQTLEDKRIPFIVSKNNGVINKDMKVSGSFALPLSKIATGYYGEQIDTWEKLAGKSSCCFKMNLYPFAFKSHDDALWTKEHFLLTGLVSKSEYKTWNQNNRFPLLKQLVNQYQPKVLICFGLSLKSEFLTAFCDNDEQIFENINQESIGDESNKSNRKIFYTKINHGNTLLMICPFPTGAYGLNSDLLLQQVAKKIKELSK